eukprot:COSAG02_NODE_57_length_43668_cov_118.217196_30_plen_133_part_00
MCGSCEYTRVSSWSTARRRQRLQLSRLAIHFSSERVADANADANDDVALEAEPPCAAAAAAAIAPLAPPPPLPPLPPPPSRLEIDAIMTAESFSMIIPLSTVSSIAISTISRFSIMERRSICPLYTRRRDTH